MAEYVVQLQRSRAGPVRKRWLSDGGCAGVAVGLTGGSCLGAVLAFLFCGALPFLRVSTMVRV